MIEEKISAFLENAEHEFLPGLTIDVVIMGFQDHTLQVLLLKMFEFKQWMLPGGYIYKVEDVDDATHRIVQDRTGLDDLYFHHFALFGNPERTRELAFHKNRGSGISPRAKKWLNQRFVTAGYFALVKMDQVTPKPDILTSACAWFSINDLPFTFFDHSHIIQTAKIHLKKQLNFLPAAKNLLPDRFTMLMLQKLYESILDDKLDRGNFQRKILKLDILNRHEKLKTGKAHKAPYLYSFDLEKYHDKLKNGIGFY